MRMGLLGPRVVTARVKRLAAKEAPGAHDASAEKAVPGDGLVGVVRTRRSEATRVGRERPGDGELVGAGQGPAGGARGAGAEGGARGGRAGGGGVQDDERVGVGLAALPPPLEVA